LHAEDLGCAHGQRDIDAFSLTRFAVKYDPGADFFEGRDRLNKLVLFQLRLSLRLWLCCVGTRSQKKGRCGTRQGEDISSGHHIVSPFNDSTK
jgi:hypothetical protein